MSDETIINLLFVFSVVSFVGFVIVLNQLKMKSKSASRFKNLYEYQQNRYNVLENDIEFVRDQFAIERKKVSDIEQKNSANRWEIKDLKNKIAEYEKIIHSGDEELADLNIRDNG